MRHSSSYAFSYFLCPYFVAFGCKMNIVATVKSVSYVAICIEKPLGRVDVFGSAEFLCAQYFVYSIALFPYFALLFFARRQNSQEYYARVRKLLTRFVGKRYYAGGSFFSRVSARNKIVNAYCNHYILRIAAVVVVVANTPQEVLCAVARDTSRFQLPSPNCASMASLPGL